MLNKQICIMGCHASDIAKSSKSPRRRKSISARCFYIFLQPNICPTSVFKSIMTSLWINEYQNWNAFYTPYISHTLRIQNIFCCMRCDTRTGLFNFWNFRCRKRSKKGLLQLWLLIALKFYFNVFPETNVVLFTCYQR